MTQMIEGAILLALGLFSLIFRKTVARQAVEAQYAMLQLRVNEAVYRIVFLVGGVLAVIIGILMLLRVLPFD